MRISNRTRVMIGGVATFIVLGASSCDQKGLGDAPIGTAYEAPREVFVMPDQFPNLVAVCDGPTRIWVTTREAAPIAVHNHPACEGADLLSEQGEEVELDGEG